MDDSYKKAYVEDWVFQVTDTSDLILPEDQGDLIPETPRVTLPVPSSTEKHRSPRFLLPLRNITRHLCLRCHLDPHVNVKSYLSPMMISCQDSRTIAFLAPISLPCGVQ